MYVLYVTILIFLVYGAQYFLYMKRWDKNLRAEAFFKVEEAYEGDEAELTETLENAKNLPLHMVKVKLQLSKKLLFSDMENSSVSDYFNRTDIFHISRGQRIRRTIKFKCAHRGYFYFNNIDLFSTDLLYTREFSKNIESLSKLYVYPRPYSKEIIEPALNRINGEVLTKRNLIEDPFEMKGIREYQPYDGMKNVNWKASAKSEELMVNLHDYTTKRSIRVFLNLEDATLMKQDDIQEVCISIGIALVIHFCDLGVPVSVFANSKDVLTDNPIKLIEGSGDTHIRAVNRALSRIDLGKGAYKFHEYFEPLLFEEVNDSYTIVISSYIREDFEEALLKMKEENLDFSWICPVDPAIDLEVNPALKDRVIEVPAKEAMYEISLS